ncbi:MAG: hypothetical protein WCK48_01250 [bacterium]
MVPEPLVQNPPYIGMTGFTDQGQVIGSIEDNIPEGHTHSVMVGVLASLETLNGRLEKLPERYPKVQKIKDIFIKDSKVLNFIHYSTTDPTTNSFVEQVNRVVEIGGKNLHGIQFNVAWPSVLALETIRVRYPGLKIVLQVGSPAMAEVMNEPGMIASWVGHYKSLVDYVLIDPSCGLARDFDPYLVLKTFQAIKWAHPSFSLGVAGGLGPDKFDLLSLGPLISSYPMMSIDVESKLRDNNDKFVVEKARRYLANAFVKFNKTR